MNRENIEADLFTFGILAMSVRLTNERREFIGTLDEHGLRLNAVIMATLFGTLKGHKSLLSVSHATVFLSQKALDVDTGCRT